MCIVYGLTETPSGAWAVHTSSKKEKEVSLDEKLLAKLDAYREARDSAVRYRDELMDRAKLHRIIAAKLDQEAVMMTDEINEQVPPAPPGH